MGLYQAMRRRMIRRAVAPVAIAFDALANEMFAEMPPHITLTRDEIVGLLRDIARRIRTMEP